MKIRILFLLLAFGLQFSVHAKTGKTLYLPKKINTIPENNDFSNNNSEYSNKRSLESDNFIVYWSKEYGDDPLLNPDLKKRFDTKKLLEQSERFFAYYTNVLKVVRKGKSVSDKHKILFLVTGGTDNTAYAWGAEDKVGILWTPASRINKEPYGVIAHELGHVFQFFANVDHDKVGFGGPINEMAAQYLLWQVYPEWIIFENYHLEGFVKKSHKAFLHPENAYHSPFLLEYWSEKHDKQFYGKMLREVKKDEDPVETYKRITKITQDQFNKEVYDASSHFVTWDLKRIEKIANKYANKHGTIMNLTGNGWYRVGKENCPENYGYNAIKLSVPTATNVVNVQFRGAMNAESFNHPNAGEAGWYYGFIAYTKDGKRVYGKPNSERNFSASFEVPKHTAYLWLVVSGAPKRHTKIGRNADKVDQWPYEIKLSGTELSL